MKCPHCKEECDRDEVHNGVGMMYGPWGCISCGWSEDERYDCREEFHQAHGKYVDGGYVTPTGGWIRSDAPAEVFMKAGTPVPLTDDQEQELETILANAVDWDGSDNEMPI